MNSFFPTGLDIEDIESPVGILREAAADWKVDSGGVLLLNLRDSLTESGNVLIYVSAIHTVVKREGGLFTVVHRRNQPYPVRIYLKDDDLPNILKKSYYRKPTPGLTELTSPFSGRPGETVHNPWVSDTPAEFRDKLKKAFNDGSVTSIIQNIIARGHAGPFGEDVEVWPEDESSEDESSEDESSEDEVTD